MARSDRIAADIAPLLAVGDPIQGSFRARAGIHPLSWGVCVVPLLIATRAPGSVGFWAVVAPASALALAVVLSTLMRHRIVAVTGSAIVMFSCIPMLTSRIRRVHTWLPRTAPLVVSADGTWRRLSTGHERLWIHHGVASLVAGLTAPTPDGDAAPDGDPAADDGELTEPVPEPAERESVDRLKVSAEG